MYFTCNTCKNTCNLHRRQMTRKARWGPFSTESDLLSTEQSGLQGLTTAETSEAAGQPCSSTSEEIGELQTWTSTFNDVVPRAVFMTGGGEYQIFGVGRPNCVLFFSARFFSKFQEILQIIAPSFAIIIWIFTVFLKSITILMKFHKNLVKE